MERYPDWRERLRRFLEENRQRPFRWGSWDCCLFACDAVREITGVDLAWQYRGIYRTPLGAIRVTHGSLFNFVDHIAKEHKLRRYINSLDAGPGDVVLSDVTDLHSTLGILSPLRMAVFSTTVGLADFPYSVSKFAWKIG